MQEKYRSLSREEFLSWLDWQIYIGKTMNAIAKELDIPLSTARGWYYKVIQDRKDEIRWPYTSENTYQPVYHSKPEAEERKALPKYRKKPFPETDYAARQKQETLNLIERVKI